MLARMVQYVSYLQRPHYFLSSYKKTQNVTSPLVVMWTSFLYRVQSIQCVELANYAH